MISTLLYDPATGTADTGGQELIQRWRQTTDRVLWIDLEDPGLEGAEDLLQSFEIHPLAIQDAMRTRHPPKLEAFEDFVFILLRGLDADTTHGIDFGVIQLALFMRERCLITVHRKGSLSVRWLHEQIGADPAMMAGGAQPLALKLMSRLVRRYVEILLELEPRLDEIEEEIFDQGNDELLAELTSYKARLRNLTRIANYHAGIAKDMLDEEHSAFDAELIHEMTDIYEQIERTQSLAALFYDVTKDLTDGYLALTSHKLNRVMQILTVITVIFVPLTFLAGIYGMNFENIPELSNPYGYFILLSVMAIVGIIQVGIFRRRGWI